MKRQHARADGVMNHDRRKGTHRLGAESMGLLAAGPAVSRRRALAVLAWLAPMGLALPLRLHAGMRPLPNWPGVSEGLVTCQVSRETYEQMLREDVAALPRSMPSLERDHIVAVLRWSVSAIYGPPYGGDLRPSCGLGCERACMGWMDFGMPCVTEGRKPVPTPLFREASPANRADRGCPHCGVAPGTKHVPGCMIG